VSVRADIGLPELIPLVIEGQNSRLAEEDVHPIVIDGWSVGGEPVIANLLLLGQSGGNRLVPQNRAIRPSQCEQMPFQFVETSARLARNEVTRITREKDHVAKNDGT
jgi:hypothetical protein